MKIQEIDQTIKSLSYQAIWSHPNILLFLNNSCLPVGGGEKYTFVFSLYCTAHQHPGQNASTQRHGQPTLRRC